MSDVWTAHDTWPLDIVSPIQVWKQVPVDHLAYKQLTDDMKCTYADMCNAGLWALSSELFYVLQQMCLLFSSASPRIFSAFIAKELCSD